MQLNKLLKILFVISLLLLIITLNFKLLIFNFNLYQKEFSKFNIYEKIPDAEKNALNLINYINNKESLNTFFNEKERLHLLDVKNLYQKLNLIFYLILIIVLIFLIYFVYTKNYKIIYESFLVSSLILIIIFVSLSLIDFSYLFEKFHILVFNNNLWQLNPNEDNLINLFPEQIQYDITKKIFINVLISAFILLILSLIMRFKSKQKIYK